MQMETILILLVINSHFEFQNDHFHFFLMMWNSLACPPRAINQTLLVSEAGLAVGLKKRRLGDDSAFRTNRFIALRATGRRHRSLNARVPPLRGLAQAMTPAHEGGACSRDVSDIVPSSYSEAEDSFALQSSFPLGVCNDIAMTHDRLDIYIEIVFWASKSHGRNPLYSCNLDFLFFFFPFGEVSCYVCGSVFSSPRAELTSMWYHAWPQSRTFCFSFLTKVTFLSLIIYPIH